jgi:hypothetical protein
VRSAGSAARPGLKCPVCRLPIGVGDRAVRLVFGRFAIPPTPLLNEEGLTVRRSRVLHEDCAEAVGVASEDIP